MTRATGTRLAPWLAALALVAIFSFRFGPLLTHHGSHFVDFAKLHGGPLLFEDADTRLNAWILAWVDHAAWQSPTSLYHANIHYPERNMLTGSEHLFGVAAQLLPFEPFIDDAITRHQLALALSSALLAATSFAAVRWACGSLWAGALAAAFALGMPWRITELGHLQLLSVQFFPLVWAGVTQCLLGESTRRSRVLLGVAIGLSLLSSFYLAYFLTFSCAVLTVFVAWLRRPRRQDAGRLLLAAAPGYLLFVASSLPYLARQSDEQLRALYDSSLAISSAQVVATLAPLWPHGVAASQPLLNTPANYWTPWAVAILATIASLYALRPAPPAEQSSPVRPFSLGLTAIALFAVVMMHGGSIEIGGTAWPTPARLFDLVVPGFSLLRGPTRWGILAATALPLLAGIGADLVDRRLGRRAGARLAVALTSAATFAWFPIPTVPAWENPLLIDLRYAAVRKLPPGPLLESPWPSNALDIELSSRAVLGSTTHWRPLLNGYTGHRPRSFRFLQRIAQRLPEARAMDQLQRLTGLRVVLRDLQRTPVGERARWAAAAATPFVREVHNSLHTRIYELATTRSSGDLLPVLLDPSPRSRTFNGLARLPVREAAGTLAVTTPRRHLRRQPSPTNVRLHNTGDETWPGFDVDPEGLVQLRYSYFPLDPDTRTPQTASAQTRLARLDADLAPGDQAAIAVQLQAPRLSGRYELCLDLVQRSAGRLHALPIPAVRKRVSVRGVAGQGELADLIDHYLRRPDPPPPCGEGH